MRELNLHLLSIYYSLTSSPIVFERGGDYVQVLSHASVHA